MLAPPRISGKAVLGIDPGTHLGYALHKPDMTVISGTLDLPDIGIDSPSRGKKTEAVRRFLARMQQEAGGRLDGIYFELSKFQAKGQGVFALMDRGGIVDMIYAWGWYSGVRCEGVAPATVKKFATGNGNSSKQDLKFIVEGWKFEPKTFDEADALAVMSWGLEQQRQAA